MNSSKYIKELIRNEELPQATCATVDCEPCAKEKYRRMFSGSLKSADDVGRLHVDTKGKVDTPSVK